MTVEVLANRLTDLVDPDVKIEKIATGFQFTEGPLWDHRDRTLHFSDIRTGIMHVWSEKDGSVKVVREGEANGNSNGNAWDKDGNMITCEHKGRRISRTLPDGTVETVVAKWGDARLNSPNDVITALNGDILFTDPTYGLRTPDGTVVGQEYPFAGVFRYWLEKGTLQLLIRDFTGPNGLVLTDDDSKMYICDTPKSHVRVFDVAADGNLTNDRLFADVRHNGTDGRPDGMKLDSRGNVYVAANTAEGIWVYDPEGTLLGFIHLGENPANLAWGDDDWQTMYVTAQTSVYRLRTKVPGQPVRFSPR